IPNVQMIKAMRRRIALQSTSCEIARNGLLRFAPAFGMPTRRRVALTRCRKSELILICALLTIAPISMFGAAESSRLLQLAGYKAVRVRYGPLNKMIMSVRINGQPANLLVDTGASQTILDTDAAESFGVKPSQRGLRYIRFTQINGQFLPVGFAQNLTADDMNFGSSLVALRNSIHSSARRYGCICYHFSRSSLEIAGDCVRTHSCLCPFCQRSSPANECRTN